MKQKLYTIIFEADTPAGKAFDAALLAAILVSVAVVMLETVASFNARHHAALVAIEWGLTILFTIEYFLRLYCARERVKYSKSFFGIIDLLSILPTYVGLILPQAHYLMIVRVLRLLRVFRIFKLIRYVHGARLLLSALRASTAKITVFLGAIVTAVIVVGALMYIIEGPENGYTSIPLGVYWAIVTLTTVGYGDLVPSTVIGQFLASVVMILGYGVIAVPTGIVTVELHEAAKNLPLKLACPHCDRTEHEAAARFCNRCGTKLPS